MNGPLPPAIPDVTPAERDPLTRNRLIEAAVHVFARKGYASASVREIAEAAGVTKPALYYHFGSKEGLLVTILRQGASAFREAMRRAVVRPGPALDRLIALCDDFYALIEETVPIVRVAHAVLLGPPDATPPFDPRVLERDIRSAFTQIIQDGQRSGEIRTDAPASDITLGLMGILEGCWSRLLHHGFDRIDIDTLHRLIRLLLGHAPASAPLSGEDKQ